MVKVCFIILIGILSHRARVVRASYQEPKSFRNDENGSSSANYKFQYAVNDIPGGNDFGHEEERNGHKTRGQYRVLLPDGRLQIVTYTADKNGYRAQVTYETRGEDGGAQVAPAKPLNQRPSKSYSPHSPSSGSAQGYSNSGRSSSGGKGSFVNVRRKGIKGGDYNYSF